MSLAEAGADAEAMGSAEVGKASVPCPLKVVTHIEIALANSDGSPAKGIPYAVTDSKGAEHQGVLGDSGSARIEGVMGFCEVWFDAPSGDKNAAAKGAPGKYFDPEKPPSCVPGMKHQFHLSDWKVAKIGIDQAALAPAPAADEESEGGESESTEEEALPTASDDDDWDLAPADPVA